MIEAKALIYRIERKLDRLNTEWKKTIDIVSICNALTEAQGFLLKERAPKFDMTKEDQYHLRQLVKRGKAIGVKKSAETSIITLPDNLYRDVGIEIIAVKRGCGEKTISLTKMESGDVPKSKSNPFWKSSYAWEQAFGSIAGNELHVYNGKDFKVKGIVIDYICQPPDIHCPSLMVGKKDYVDWNGKIQTRDQGWVLDDLVDEGINLAAMMLTSDGGDYRDFQLQLSNNIQTEQTKKF